MPNSTATLAPDYGIDAPGVIRNLLIAAIAGLAIWTLAALTSWDGVVSVGPVAGATLRFPLATMGCGAGVALLATALWMLWSSKTGKIREREGLLDRLKWRGDERVLDVGCGRGLLLVGAANRLTTGRATGIDIWNNVDLSGNQPAAPLENARREGVADRVDVETADMRALPFAADTFTVIVSRAAIHNLYSRDDRARAVREIARVLAPGGSALIDDIRHGREYAAAFKACGCEVRDVAFPPATWFVTALTWGALRPTTLIALKERRAD